MGSRRSDPFNGAVSPIVAALAAGVGPVMAQLIPPARVAHIWPQAEAALRVVTDFGSDIDMAKVLGELVAGRLALWLVGHGWVVTEVTINPDGKRTFWVLMAGGTVGEKLSALTSETMAQFEALARRSGYMDIRIWGRRGWKRLLPDYDALPLEGGRVELRKVL